ncbi:hypothetical protein PTSG_01424 [Salpingoeca rosetta]|uniref:Uncharacterized protein n=1 Tax=Salpingoeca rosetta (strain ATCC 50818 / BSB-021) TaxID=946362 RepID=F2U0B0_SALR5|nr:uncharacterized protein PTSG_01424 [Salpingoeca rosetta]EGD80838.1 hypothetical protein PTSG_01424 [Salpingoeca rosetta]|eukprot:XP_004997399.1 hypothetical protein PTSG_01424 [Salpingoeca rosetta]
MFSPAWRRRDTLFSTPECPTAHLSLPKPCSNRLKAPLSIYDPEGPESAKYVALPEEQNDLYPFVRQARLLLVGAIDYTQSYVTQAKATYSNTKRIYKDFMSHVPESEKNVMGLLVATSLQERAKQLRDVLSSLDSPKPSGDSDVANTPATVAPTATTTASEAATVSASDADVQASVDALARTAPNNNTSEPATSPEAATTTTATAATEAATTTTATAATQQASDDDAAAAAATVLVVDKQDEAHSGEMAEDRVEKDYGQAHQEDLDTYTSRR